MELPSVGKKGGSRGRGLAGGAGVAEGDQQRVFTLVVVPRFQGERIVGPGLFGLRESVGVALLRRDVTGRRQSSSLSSLR
ncbi:hypothetical protein ACFY6U_05410 [Streptomyces sp. NPDC013157]|uniref:hypothetical protein n=1 Tax=Streptomyces sp. NPDC013157 TaxID=3364861 RepID=UPI0036C3B9A9